MSTNTRISSVREMRESLIGKASEDLEFRARLTTDPRAAVHEALGVEIPEWLNVQVHEETADTAHLVLPPSAALDEQTLAQAQGAHVWDGIRWSLGLQSVGSS